MKERESIELTTKQDNSTLEMKGDIFMPEPGGGEVPQMKEEKNSSSSQSEKKPNIRKAVVKETLRRTVFGKKPRGEKSDEVQEISRKAWEEFYKGKQFLPGEKGVVEQIIREGGMPGKSYRPEVTSAASQDISESQEVGHQALDESLKEDIQPSEIQIPENPSQAEEPSAKTEYMAGDLDSFRGYFRKVLPDADPEQINQMAKDALENVKRREASDLPNSFEELVALIMKFQEPEWKTDGDYQLIDKEGRVVKENFMAWVRKRMVDLHEFNPTSAVNFFSDINVKAGYSVISFYDMIFTGSYFLEKKYKPELSSSDEGKLSFGVESELQHNDDYKEMKDQLITEAFLFQNSRNNHITYLQTMHDEKELPRLLNQIYYANPLTRGKYLEKVLTMPSMDQGKIQELRTELGIQNILESDSEEIKRQKTEASREFEAKKIQNLIKNESEVGEGVRKALLAYYYINDFEMLEKILGEDSLLFTKEYLEYDSVGKLVQTAGENGQARNKTVTGSANDEAREKEERHVKYDSQTGKLIQSEENKDDFINYINVFNDGQKDERIVNEVRERIRQTLVKNLGINYSEAKYAEAWAFSMTRWTGIGARNDVNAVGFDAWSKTQNFMEYRLKQMEPKRAGVVGNIFNLMGLKKTSLSFFEGITDIHGRTMIEAIQGGEGSDIKTENPFRKKKEPELEGSQSEKIKGLEFSQDVAQRFSANHIYSAFGIYDFIVNHSEFHLEEMVTFDATGRPIIDQKKANEIIDGIQKHIRYAYSTWKGIDYSKNIRSYEKGKIKIEDKENPGSKKDREVMVGKEMPIVASMFGPAILKFIQKDMERKGLVTEEDKKSMYQVGEGENSFGLAVSKIKKGEERDILWKHVMKYLVSQEIKSHRTIESDLARYSYATTERIYSFLRSKGIVNDEDIKDMRDLSSTSEKRMFAEEFALEFGKGIGKGTWSAFKIFLKSLAS